MSAEAATGWAPAPSEAPPGGASELSDGFLDFLRPLHERLTPRQQELARRRGEVLAAAHRGDLPDHLPPSEATEGDWAIELPEWCRDQRNQMTGPADDGELVVKMMNSGAPGVMLDLEDSMANAWPNLVRGLENIASALHGELSYFDRKRDREVSITGEPAVLTRPRGLHMSQAGVLDGLVSASLFDAASVVYSADPERLRHPLAFYIPKSESAEEALWWADLFGALEEARGLPSGWIRCMALVEAHPLAYQMEEFLYNLRRHILGLNLGRWDYMASLIHFTFEDPEWVLPDRNTIPHDVPFFQRVRELLPELCHRRGALAIGGMTALYPSREDQELNERALAVLEQDKGNEARSGMDGAWTGHPDQNQIAVDQFPEPNQLGLRRPDLERYPDLRPKPAGVGERTEAGTRAAVRTVIRYRNGVLLGRGASLLDGYMEDLATDRIYRLMIGQRIRHGMHSREKVSRLFDQELERILGENPPETHETFREARRLSEAMVESGRPDPV